MAHYLDPKNDLTFKRIFGEHAHLCMSLLNSMLPLDEAHRIVELEYMPAELTPAIPGLKNSIVDVRCKDGLGRQFIVEMQMLWTDSFTVRVLLNASKAYIKQLDRGIDYNFLQPVYALSFVNEIFEPSLLTEYYHHYRIVNIQHTEKQIEGLEFVFIELPKFIPGNLGERKLHELWLRFLTEIKKGAEVVSSSLLSTDETREAVQYLELGSYTKEELDAYDKYCDAIMVEKAIRNDSLAKGREEGIGIGIEIGREKGIEIGREKGIEIGREEGIEIGREKGEAERLAIKEALEKEKIEKEALKNRIAELERRMSK
ncbi:MAG: Rpn family recombination-promoting nuclease/putative transposase [Bacteroidales bacterium]|jgi:predicted transposase/invertase (TIGR01784 family)|nr:Rpn family recombination-promoting nuclease/putative transposase [Bacteroidales bacterium]